MNNETERQETEPTHSTRHRATTRQMAAAHRAKGRVQQSAAECSRMQVGQGQRWSATLCVSPIWAHDSEAPWPVVVPEAWHRFRGQTRQGSKDRPDEVSLSASPKPGSQPGWDETKAAVAGCKRSNRSRRTRYLATWLRLPCGTGTHLWHAAAGKRGRSSVEPQRPRRDLLLPSETSRPRGGVGISFSRASRSRLDHSGRSC